MELWDRAAHKLEESLVAHGLPARATVIEARLADTRLAEASGFKPGEKFNKWLAALRLEPEEGTPFEVRLEMQVRDTITLESGFKLDVLFDPADTSRIAVDPKIVPRTIEDELTWLARARAEAQGFDLTGLEDANATEIQAVIRERRSERANQEIAAALKSRHDGAHGPPSGPSGVRADKDAKLEQLERLRSANLIDQAQYEASRQRILDGG